MRSGEPPRQVAWPEGKRFAFTIFDDPDGCTVETRQVYYFLRDLGFRTTMAVWPLGVLRPPNAVGETCAEPGYVSYARGLQEAGFEMAFHNAAPHSCTREEIAQSLERFRECFGMYPQSAANHFGNQDGMYWGSARLQGKLSRAVYDLATLGRQRKHYQGHVEGSPYYWGDLCRERIRYYRNFVYREINTLKAAPLLPYTDAAYPYVQAWFCASEGTDCESFVEMISEENLDRLEQEGGLCIMYTHLGKGFLDGNRLHPRFVELMTRLSRKNGWFAPVTTILDHLTAVRGKQEITPGQRRALEWKWLSSKLVHGTS